MTIFLGGELLKDVFNTGEKLARVSSKKQDYLGIFPKWQNPQIIPFLELTLSQVFRIQGNVF